MRLFVCIALLLPLLASAQSETLLQKIDKDPRFTILRKLMKAAGMDTTLGGDKAYTLFAPTDAAFQKLPAGALKAILKQDRLATPVVMAHVLEGRYGTLSFMNGISKAGEPLTYRLTMEGGYHLTTICGNDGLTVNGLRVANEMFASNGTIVMLDSVMPIYVDHPKPDGLSARLPQEFWKWGMARFYDPPKS